MKGSQRILVIEDDVDLGELIGFHLRECGYQVDVIHDGVRGLVQASSGSYDLIVLDINLPGMDGHEICKKLRSSFDTTPILMLTSRGKEADKVRGLEIGGDDYLPKPFGFPEFIARIKALLRRSEQQSSRGDKNQSIRVLDYGFLTIDIDRRRVERRGKRLELTAKEYDLLAFLALRPGRPFTRAELLHGVWGYSAEGYEHTVSSHINRLRAKLEENPSEPVFVQTVWGVGYRFADEEDLRKAGVYEQLDAA